MSLQYGASLDGYQSNAHQMRNRTSHSFHSGDLKNQSNSTGVAWPQSTANQQSHPENMNSAGVTRPYSTSAQAPHPGNTDTALISLSPPGTLSKMNPQWTQGSGQSSSFSDLEGLDFTLQAQAAPAEPSNTEQAAPTPKLYPDISAAFR